MGVPPRAPLVYAARMSDDDKGFRIHRAAGGRLPSTPKTRREFPVETKQGVRKFQRKTVEKPRRWVTVCTVPTDNGVANLRHHYGKVLDRAEGKDFRFIFQAK